MFLTVSKRFCKYGSPRVLFLCCLVTVRSWLTQVINLTLHILSGLANLKSTLTQMPQLARVQAKMEFESFSKSFITSLQHTLDTQLIQTRCTWTFWFRLHIGEPVLWLRPLDVNFLQIVRVNLILRLNGFLQSWKVENQTRICLLNGFELAPDINF